MGSNDAGAREVFRHSSSVRGAILTIGQDRAFLDSLQDSLGADLTVFGDAEATGSLPILVLVSELPAEGLRGLSRVAALRARCPGAPLVLLALYDHRFQEARSILDRIADVVILKPVDMDGLAHTIRTLVDRAQPPAGPPSGREEDL